MSSHSLSSILQEVRVLVGQGAYGDAEAALVRFRQGFDAVQSPTPNLVQAAIQQLDDIGLLARASRAHMSLELSQVTVQKPYLARPSCPSWTLEA